MCGTVLTLKSTRLDRTSIFPLTVEDNNDASVSEMKVRYQESLKAKLKDRMAAMKGGKDADELEQEFDDKDEITPKHEPVLDETPDPKDKSTLNKCQTQQMPMTWISTDVSQQRFRSLRMVTHLPMAELSEEQGIQVNNSLESHTTTPYLTPPSMKWNSKMVLLRNTMQTSLQNTSMHNLMMMATPEC